MKYIPHYNKVPKTVKWRLTQCVALLPVQLLQSASTLLRPRHQLVPPSALLPSRLFAVHLQVIRSALIEINDCFMVVRSDRKAVTTMLTKRPGTTRLMKIVSRPFPPLPLFERRRSHENRQIYPVCVNGAPDGHGR